MQQVLRNTERFTRDEVVENVGRAVNQLCLFAKLPCCSSFILAGRSRIDLDYRWGYSLPRLPRVAIWHEFSVGSKGPRALAGAAPMAVILDGSVQCYLDG